MAPWTTPPTVEAVVGEAVVCGASLLLVVAAAEALADEVLAGGALGAGGFWGDVLTPAAEAPLPLVATVEPTAEPVADPAVEATADEAAEATDTTPLAA